MRLVPKSQNGLLPLGTGTPVRVCVCVCVCVCVLCVYECVYIYIYARVDIRQNTRGHKYTSTKFDTHPNLAPEK